MKNLPDFVVNREILQPDPDTFVPHYGAMPTLHYGRQAGKNKASLVETVLQPDLIETVLQPDRSKTTCQVKTMSG